MKEHGLNFEKKLVLDCAKLCDFLDHPLKLNILKYANEIKKVLSKKIKMVEKLIGFHVFHSFWSCLNVEEGLVYQKQCFGEKN